MRNDFQEGAFLAHSAKGTSWKNVQYLKKVQLSNGKPYYIYTQQELDAWNKRHSIDKDNNVLSDEYKSEVKKQVLNNSLSIEQLQKSHFAVKGNTTEEKTANIQKNIEDGQKKIQETLSKEKSSKKSKSSGSGSSGKSKSGSSGKKSGSSKASASKAKSEAASKKQPAESTKKTTATTKKAENKTPINMDTLKKVYGAKDEDVTTHNVSSSEFKSEMLSKYKDGSFGYLMAGSKAYKWTISNGNLVLKDFDTDKEVSFDTYLKNAKTFKEFQTNNKTKKK